MSLVIRLMGNNNSSYLFVKYKLSINFNIKLTTCKKAIRYFSSVCVLKEREIENNSTFFLVLFL